jgi:hypothetical protein
MKTRLLTIVAAAALCATSGLATAVPADAVTVPNQWKCSKWTKKCVPTNSHVAGLPNVCYWTYSVYWTGTAYDRTGC